MWNQAFDDFSQECHTHTSKRKVVYKHRKLKLGLIEELFESQQAVDGKVASQPFTYICKPTKPSSIVESLPDGQLVVV